MSLAPWIGPCRPSTPSELSSAGAIKTPPFSSTTPYLSWFPKYGRSACLLCPFLGPWGRSPCPIQTSHKIPHVSTTSMQGYQGASASNSCAPSMTKPDAWRRGARGHPSSYIFFSQTAYLAVRSSSRSRWVSTSLGREAGSRRHRGTWTASVLRPSPTLAFRIHSIVELRGAAGPTLSTIRWSKCLPPPQWTDRKPVCQLLDGPEAEAHHRGSADSRLVLPHSFAKQGNSPAARQHLCHIRPRQ